jgi:hypothetical protein
MRAIFLVLFLAGCATPGPIPLIPVHHIPPDLKLVCYQGRWAVVSHLAEQGVVFGQGCVQA